MNFGILKLPRQGDIFTKLIPIILIWNIFTVVIVLQMLKFPADAELEGNGGRIETKEIETFLNKRSTKDSDLFFSSDFGRLSPCSYETFVLTVVRFIKFGGKYSLESLLPEECSRVHPSKIITRRVASHAFKNAFRELGINCAINSTRNKTLVSDEEVPSITLFTTHGMDAKGKSFKNTTFTNWSLLEKVVKLLFTNHIKLESNASTKLWNPLPVTHQSEDGYPVLRTMFNTAMRISLTDFYVYANSDILFDTSMLETVTSLKQFFDFNRRPILVIGRRTNVYHITSKEAENHFHLRKTSVVNGELFTTGAEDYIITTRLFPWKTVPNLVVGRLAYDNWLVAHARCTLKIDVIDVTETLLAVHHTTKTGTWESAQKPNSCYNTRLLKEGNRSLNFQAGLTSCAEWMTIRNLCGDIQVVRRDALHESCKCGQ